MANTIISLENVNGRWVGEVEVGSPISRRSVIRSDSFEDAIVQITAAYQGYMSTFADRPIHSGPGVSQPPLPISAQMAADIPLDPETNSPKLPRGRHRATCDCPRCEAKKIAASADTALVDEVAAL